MPADERLELRVLAQDYAVRRGEALDQPEARVVARALVLLAWVAQAHDETDQGLLLLFLLALVGSGLLGSLGSRRRALLAALGGRSALGTLLAFLRRGGLLGGRDLGRRDCSG